MPIYEYKCRNCGYNFERTQQFSDQPVTECPECHHEVHRLFSPPLILFNGPGFYVTDNAKSGANGKEEKPSTMKNLDKIPKGATCKMCA
jgi:putative FmdB family regulatory protein